MEIWVWLRPIFGAVATIIPVLITVYCVRRGKPLGESGDVISDGATDIPGGVYFNFGEQGDHSQNLLQIINNTTITLILVLTYFQLVRALFRHNCFLIAGNDLGHG